MVAQCAKAAPTADGAASTLATSAGEAPVLRQDAHRTAPLRDVRLDGWLGAKIDRFIARRLVDPAMREQVFDEARQAFEFRDDDDAKVGGLWRGEFWGKEMLSSARVAEYLQNPEFLSFVREECHRLMAFQDADGYLGSYADKDFVAIGVLRPMLDLTTGAGN